MHRFRIDPLDDIVKMAAHQSACHRDDPGRKCCNLKRRLQSDVVDLCGIDHGVYDSLASSAERGRPMTSNENARA